jgi:hypothetical protein
MVISQMECLEVRERLAEYAVSTLPLGEEQEVERHLQWCAGCRKEASDLGSGAAMIGLSLAQAEPAPQLEDRVVSVIRDAAVKPPLRRRRSKTIRVVTLFAAIVALLGVGLAGALFAQQQTTESRLATSEHLAHRYLVRLNALLEEFRGQAARPHDMARAILAPPAGGHGGGGALRVASPRFDDLAVVIVGGLPQRGAPYSVWLLTPSGRKLSMGRMQVDSGGGGIIAKAFRTDLKLYHYALVRDARGRLRLSGGFDPS